jgi:hypothetical protein
VARAGGTIGVGAAAVVDNDGLGKLLADLFEHDARGDVVGIAGREGNDRGDIARRIVLRGRLRDGGERSTGQRTKQTGDKFVR